MAFQSIFNTSIIKKVNFSTEQLSEVISSYTIKYHSGVSDRAVQYTIKYNITAPTNFVNQYKIRSIYKYDDVTTSYTIRYTTGRELQNYTDYYRIRFTILNTKDFSNNYKIRYESEVVKLDKVDRYFIKYSTDNLVDNNVRYSIKYTTTGLESEQHRRRYTIKYTSQNLGEYVQTFKIKYSTSVFYEDGSIYRIKYDSEASEETLIRAAVIKRKGEEVYDVLFEIKGIENYALDNYLTVLSNMPKYQLVEFLPTYELPYVVYYSSTELAQNDVFIPYDLESYSDIGYILLKDVNIYNPISIDLYSIEKDYEKVNKAKSYFFELTGTDVFVPTSQTIGTTEYELSNTNAYYYNYNNLNFTSVHVEPRFNIASSCCFSQKILPPGQSGGGGACSPF